MCATARPRLRVNPPTTAAAHREAGVDPSLANGIKQMKTRLIGNRGVKRAAEQRSMYRSVLVERANRHAADVASTVKDLQAGRYNDVSRHCRGTQRAWHSDRERPRHLARHPG